MAKHPVAALVAVPFGVANSGTALIQPWVLVAGLGVALLSTVIPYSLELEALRKIPLYRDRIGQDVGPADALS